MRTKIPFKWENLEITPDYDTYRLAVFGGWKVMTTLGKTTTSVFVPDRDHLWQPVPPEIQPEEE